MAIITVTQSVEVTSLSEVEQTVEKIRESGPTELRVAFTHAPLGRPEASKAAFRFPSSEQAKQAARAVRDLGNAILSVEVINLGTGRSLRIDGRE